ncbi:hypothetical protein T261_5822 [Streptomyces lydicus]|nr:hypothetical protein T261_5822 [Streptomyces lydicus]
MEAFTKEHAQNSEEFQLLSDAFAASALVRGVAHDQQAQALGGAQILHHPMRRSILSKLQEQPVSVVEIDPDPQRFLANAGLAYALTEKDLDRRIGAWVDFIAKIRSLANSREITLHGEALDEDSAKGIAVEALRRAGVTQWSRREDNIYDALWTAFSNFLTCFVLTQGYAFSAGVTLTYIGQRAKAGVARVTGGRASQLDNLAERGPGRLNGEWRHSSLYETL